MRCGYERERRAAGCMILAETAVGLLQGEERTVLVDRLAEVLEVDKDLSLAELRASRSLRAGVEVYLRLLSGASDASVLAALTQGLERGALKVPERQEGAVWNLRLQTWARYGGASERTLALEALLRSAISPELLERLVKCGVATSSSVAKPIGASDIQVWATKGRAAIPIVEFVALELDVDWSGPPRAGLGILGGRPIQSQWLAERGEGALRVRRAGQELLVPFTGLRLPARGETGRDDAGLFWDADEGRRLLGEAS